MPKGSSAEKTALVRIRAETQRKLRQLAQGRPLTHYLDELTEREYERARLAEFNAAYARLRERPERYAAYRAESRELEGTLGDGLDETEGVAIDDAAADTATW